MAKWISCEEELPDDGVLVLVTDKKTVDIGYYEVDDGLWDSEFAFLDPDGITHWMPFQDPLEIGEF